MKERGNGHAGGENVTQHKAMFLSENMIFSWENTAALLFLLTLQCVQTLTRRVSQPADEAVTTHTQRKTIETGALDARDGEKTQTILKMKR